MNILIIGGTRFLGRFFVETALAHRHTLTLFNRGQSNPDIFPDVELIKGDREHNLGKLANRTWDVVLDTCGYVPRLVRDSALALERSVGRYVFISSISAYDNFSKIGMTEEDPPGPLSDESDDNNPETYGFRKTRCEKNVRDVYNDRALIVRPGLIVGPHDATDRFTYWPVRISKGGDVIAPENSNVPVQIIDVRDLAEFIMRLIEANASGIYNATGPAKELTIGEMLDTCKQVSGSNAKFHWASPEFLHHNNVQPWSDMPVWIPNIEEDKGFSRMDVSKAVNAGLKFRPLEETVRDTIAWVNTRPADYEFRSGLKPEQEQELIKLLNS